MEIRVAIALLQNLATQMEETSSTLRNYTDLTGSSLACTPVVEKAYVDLGGRWDKRRDELTTGLDEIAQGFRTAAQAFEQVDAEHANELTSREKVN